MGAFFLYKKNIDIDKDAARMIFKQKGFDEPEVHDLGKAEIWHYKKQFMSERNIFESEKGVKIFVTGTMVYKDCGCSESIKRLEDDYEKGKVEYNELLGAFCVIFLRKDKIEILTDRMYIYHIFLNSDFTMVSSSFLAMVMAMKGKLNVNRLECLVNLTCGCNLSPNTYVNEIVRTDKEVQERINSDLFQFLGYPEDKMTRKNRYETFQSCVSDQLEGLKDNFRSIEAMANEYDVDIGISGGYDSRLLLLLARNLHANISTHTHVKQIDDGDYGIAHRLTKEMSLPFNTKKTKYPEIMSEEELEETAREALLFFDGRANTGMGWLKPEYTRQYRKTIMAGKGLTITGVGGEIFRNYNFTAVFPVKFINWVAYYVIGYPILYAIRNAGERNNIISAVARKVAKKLNINVDGSIDFYTSKRFYAEVWLPDWHGLKNSVENQIACYIGPFTQYRTVRRSYSAIPYIGIDGELEAAIIRTLDPDIAKIKSIYGFGFDRIPLKYKIFAGLRVFAPNKMKLAVGMFAEGLRKRREPTALQNLLEKHQLVRNAMDRLNQLNLPIDWDRYMTNGSNRVHALSFGYILHYLSEKLNIDV